VPRGVQLQQVVDEVRRKAGQSTNPAIGQQMTEVIKDDIRRIYRWLHSSWDWPHLVAQDADKTVSAGSYIYAFPNGIDPDRINAVWFQKAGAKSDVWAPLEYGIGYRHRNTYMSAEDERSDPVRRWERYSETQFEVWPVPGTDGGVVHFEGMKAPKQLVNDSDTIDLDSDAIVLYVAGEMLAEQQSPRAERVLQQAADRLRYLKGNSQVRSRYPVSRASDRDAPAPPRVNPKAPRT